MIDVDADCLHDYEGLDPGGSGFDFQSNMSMTRLCWVGQTKRTKLC